MNNHAPDNTQLRRPNHMMRIRWCVVITTRNRAEMLRRAIESCMKQTVSCEIIVVDDASEDNTRNTVSNYHSVTYIRNSQPLGQSAAANIGINATSADWIKHLDNDDWLAPNCLELMTKALDRAYRAKLDPVLISARAINVDIYGQMISRTPSVAEDTVIVSSRNLLQLMMLDLVPIGTPVQVGHSRESALRVGGWNEHRLFKHMFGGDAEFWIRLAAAGDSIFVPESLAYRTIWAGNDSKTTSIENRYLTNVHLKDLLAAQLGILAPQSIKSYLALNWALIALRERSFKQFFVLILSWLRRPHSLIYFVLRRNRNRANKSLAPIPNLS